MDDNSNFICLDCSVSTLDNKEYYMLKFGLWKLIHPKNSGMLCIGCVEKRLGRTLTSSDFLDCPLNDMKREVIGFASDRLYNRLNN